MIFLPILGFAQQDSVLTGKYSWAAPSRQVQKNILSATLFQGKVHDFEWLQMNANTIAPAKKKTALKVPANEEHLLIIKSGSLTISLKDSSNAIGPGSIALLMPGEKYALQNTGNGPCDYYVLKYRSRKPVDIARGNSQGGSFIKDWNKIAFKPHEKGGVRNYFQRPTAMCKRFEMHVTTLKEGLKSHDPHTHPAEEIILVIDNKTEIQLADKFYKGAEGTIYYLGTNVPHAIRNDGIGTCTYFAFQFE